MRSAHIVKVIQASKLKGLVRHYFGYKCAVNRKIQVCVSSAQGVRVLVPTKAEELIAQVSSQLGQVNALVYIS